jgi:hypothetical protein
MHRIRATLSFANVVSVLALVLALTSGAYAAGTLINGKDIKKHSISGGSIKKDTITGKNIVESTLKGVTHCPGVAPNQVGDICFTGPQPSAGWQAAVLNCKSVGLRLPDVGELTLVGAVAQFTNSWTDDAADVDPTPLATVVASKAAPFISTKALTTSLPSRCITNPLSPDKNGR